MYLETPLSLWDRPSMLLLVLGITLVVGLLSGLYPALMLSSYRPALVLKGQTQGKFSRTLLRRVLVVIQYIMAIVLIISTIVVNRQFDMVRRVDLGYQRDNILWASFRSENREKMASFRQSMLRVEGVEQAALSTWVPVDWGSHAPNMKTLQVSEDENTAVWARSYPVGYDYIETLGMHMVQGRSFSKTFKDQDNIVITESFARKLHWDNPVGHTLFIDQWRPKIIGVVKDFHFTHVFFKARPGILMAAGDNLNVILLRTQRQHLNKVKAQFEALWKTEIPDQPLRLRELDSHFVERFKKTVKGQELISLLSSVAIFFACLGLVGLASFTIARMTKEIAVRKILGASVRGITGKLIIRFMVLVGLANLIALPLGFFNARFIVDMGWVVPIALTLDIFLIATGISIATAVIAVVWQSHHAANRHPAQALRAE